MKKKILFLLLFGSVGALHANNVLKVHQKDGTIISYSFSEKPKITYSENVIILTTATTQVEYPLPEMQKISFDVTADAIEQITTDNFLDEIVKIYNINGVLINSYRKTDSSIIVPLDDLSTGIYIIKNGKTTYKVRKK